MSEEFQPYSGGYGRDTDITIPSASEAGLDGSVPKYQLRMLIQVRGGDMPEGTYMEIDLPNLLPDPNSPLTFTVAEDPEEDLGWDMWPPSTYLSLNIEKMLMKPKEGTFPEYFYTVSHKQEADGE